ncbi:MAG: hypothetical protein AB7O52_06740 [Planctomycetota bacterium]
MIGEPRTIARILELIHLPVQHGPDVLRDVYLAISSSCGYDNFIRMADGARLETASSQGGGFSRVTFGSDRIVLHEEHNNVGVETFLRRAQEVLRVSTEKVAIPVLVCRNVTLRAVASVPGGRTAPQFLGENLIRISDEEFQKFGRPGGVIGLRMHFPPADMRGGLHQVRVESYLRDPRSVFLEDVASFKMPLQGRDMGKLGEELMETEDFLHERVVGFLGQFPRA